MSKRKKVRNSLRPKKNVSSPRNELLIPKLYIDFTRYPHWTDSIVGHTFVNAFKDTNEAARNFYFILHNVLPDIEEQGPDIFSGRNRHCHPITGDKLEYAKKIIKKIDGLDIENDTNLWQLAAKNAREIRIVGSIVTDKMYIFYPLYIDHFHQMYKDVNYNQADLKHNKFKPQDHFK